MTNLINKATLTTLLTLSLMFFATTMFASDHNKSMTAEKDIVTIAVEAGSFNTLAAALTEAGLIAT